MGARVCKHGVYKVYTRLFALLLTERIDSLLVQIEPVSEHTEEMNSRFVAAAFCNTTATVKTGL